MKLHLLMALMVCCSSRAQAFGPLNPEDNVDKFAHFGLSCALTASLETVGKGQNRFHEITRANRLYSSASVLVLGIYKEQRDLTEDGSRSDSARDILADLVGIAIGNLIHWEF